MEVIGIFCGSDGSMFFVANGMLINFFGCWFDDNIVLIF